MTENVTVTYPGQPSQLQKSGALVSVGGTTLTTGDYQYCASLADVTAILSSSGNYTELTNMATTFFAQGSLRGVYVLELGTVTDSAAGITALDTWLTDNPNVFYGFLVPQDWDTIPAPATPSVAVAASGSSTLPAGTYYTVVAYVDSSGNVGATSASVSSVVSTADTDELTVTSPVSLTGATNYYVYMGTTSSALYLQNGTGTAIGTDYSQTAPIITTSGSPPTTLATLAANNSSDTSKVYFFVLSTQQNVAAYGTMGSNSVWVGTKSVIAVVPSPSAASTEFTSAAWLYNVVANDPGPANWLAPMQYRYLYGVTPWPATGQSTAIQSIANYGGNWVGTGAEGGISQNCIFKGTTSSLVQISEWYGVDWAGINTDQALAAAVINGTNNNPPLEYDQAGVNTLAEVAQQYIDNAVSYKCLQSGTVSAVSYPTYVTENPTDYPAGIYNGLSASVVGQAGFLNITFNLNVSGL